jgi:phosphate transport system protein
MENHFETGIENLRQQLLLMASHTEKSVGEAVQALMQRDLDLALRVKADDDVIDQFEVEIDEMAILLLTKAPLASDLRLVTGAMKISQNLERIGDEASKIAKRARDLSTGAAGENPARHPAHGRPVARHGQGRARLLCATRSRRRPRPHSARQGGGRPQQADSPATGGHMMAHPDTIARCLHWMVAAKSLERIADHAKNIAEEVVYLCEAPGHPAPDQRAKKIPKNLRTDQ